MKMNIKRSEKGFTLIELMIVVAIIGILAAIAIPKFADLVNKSKEASVKGSMGSLRSAISIYYSDTEGVFPSSSATGLAVSLTTGNKYLKEIPYISLPRPADHQANLNTVTSVQADASGWVYTQIDGDANVNCTHTDTKSSVWSSW